MIRLEFNAVIESAERHIHGYVDGSSLCWALHDGFIDNGRFVRIRSVIPHLKSIFNPPKGDTYWLQSDNYYDNDESKNNRLTALYMYREYMIIEKLYKEL